MSEIDTQLSTLFDEVAATISPSTDFESVIAGGGSAGSATPGGSGRPFRRGLVAAAAAVVLFGGAAAAFQLDGEPEMVATEDVTASSTTISASTAPTSVPEPTTPADEAGTATPTPAPAVEREEPKQTPPVEVVRTALLGDGQLDGDPLIQVVRGRAPIGELVTLETPYGSAEVESNGVWKAMLELHDVPGATLVPIRVTFAGSDDVVELTFVTPTSQPEPKPEPQPAPTTTVAIAEPEPKPEPEPEPKPEPKPVDFTAKLGGGIPEGEPMKQVVHGTATAGTKVLVTSAYGHVIVVAGEGGGWEAHLKMYDVPAGTNVRITATASGFAQEYEFWVERPAPKPEPQPEAKPFAADLAAKYLEGDPIKMVFHGTGAPGSVTKAASEFGVAEAVVGEAGKWELALKMPGVPSGATVGIRVTNSASESVYEYSVTKPAAPTHEFSAEAAFVECDSTPPFNEYWGTGTPGSTITISSPYGGAQVTVGEAGKWDARVEFPEAPLGQVFEVVISSSKDGASVGLPFKRVEPA